MPVERPGTQPRPGQYAGDAERSDALAADDAGGCGQNRGPDPRVRFELAAACTALAIAG